MMNTAIKWGIIYGLINIVLYGAIYAIDYTLLVSPWMSLLFIPMIVFPVLGTLALRKEEGGFLVYGKAVMSCLTILVVSTLMGMIFQALLYHVIDTELAAKVKEATIAQTQGMMESFGASDADVEKAVAAVEEKNFDQTPVELLKGFLVGSVVSLVLSLILAIFLKKNKPVFENFNDSNE